jgi:hypothetical protein
MKHLETSSAWADVTSSLMAAGVDRVLAVGIVEILADASQTDPEIRHTPLILTQTQRVRDPKRSSKEWDVIAQTLPRLFLTTQELLVAPDLKQKHKIHQYCRRAALTEGASGTD